MAKRSGVRRLSAAEMEILQMLWKHGEVTLSAAHQALGLPIGYTTVQTRLNRLVLKGLVKRRDERPARYSAAVAQDAVSAGDLNLLVQRVSGGSVVPLVAQLVRDRSLTAAEIAELKQLLDAAEQRLQTEKRGKKP
ncbi:MAG TPA: BlaI/MecI/CopY family transcriptional regulator [Pirellulales bacterium]|jgi:predicted transcriptional regulator|nr:BlaI/MecI/CopY family transcriptional regulator [Pirellulales bacterium]